MALNNFSGDTFVAFIDISGFKKKMKSSETEALNTLNCFYQAGYDALEKTDKVEGVFVTDCGILFANDNNNNDDTQKLKSILQVVKAINQQVLQEDITLTINIAYGKFDYHNKVEFNGIEKAPVFGFAYLNAFRDSTRKGKYKIQPGECRLLVEENVPQINFNNIPFFNNILSLKRKGRKVVYWSYYWNLQNENNIQNFRNQYQWAKNQPGNSKYETILQLLKNQDL